MNDEDEVSILFDWTTCKPDGGAYKPYSPELDPVNVYVEVKIPRRYVKRVDDKGTVISALGMAIALKKLANAIGRVQTGENDESGNE